MEQQSSGAIALRAIALTEAVPKPAGVVRRFLRSRLAVIGLAVLVILYSVAIFAPLVISENDTTKMDLLNLLSPPSPAVPFGTDEFGRSALYRVIYGGRVSLFVGFSAAALDALIGTILGAIAGYYGGRIDTLIMRFTDFILSLPFFFLLILAATVTKPSAFTIVIIIGALRWTTMARLVRGEFLSLRQREFVEASRALGNGAFHTIVREILPNAMAPIIVNATLAMAGAILAESSISFLGLGIQPPTPSWGNMLTKAQGYLIQAPWLAFFPGAFIFITVLSFNVVGDALRDTLDPRLRQ